MDSTDEKKNKFDDSMIYQNTPANSMKTIEKKKSLASTSKSCIVYDKPKGLHHNEGSTSSKIHKCEFCNKIFKCGKGLGGHKRVHLQALRKEREPKIKIECNSSNDNDDGKLSCGVCKKNFPSNKALYGHMRSHPQREWRGSASNSKGLAINDGESKSWPPRSFKTDKRGRKRILSDEVVNSSQILMYMSTDKWLDNNLNESLDNEDEKEKGLPSTSCLVGDIDETKLKNDNNKRRKMLVKLENPSI